MGTEAQEKSDHVSAKKKQLRLRAMALAALGLAVFLYIETQDHLPWEDGHNEQLGPVNAFDTTYVDPLESLKNCTITFHPPTNEKGEWSTKPIWFPAHPGSMEDAFLKQLITGITGLPAGGKSFYASSKASGLRKCFGPSETAACFNVHPVVDMGDYPDTQSDKFYNKIILGMRNPMFALPSFYNGKQIKYHGLCDGCQVSEDEWRPFRDEWLESMMDEWVKTVETWKKMTKYSVGMYLAQEHIWDPVRGPLVLQRLANLLKEAGFTTPDDDEEIPCIWLKIMGGEEAVKAHHGSPYEYPAIPGYTVPQREMMFEKLNDLAAKHVNDTELVDVLREYQNDIRTKARIDTGRKLWSNSTDEAALEPPINITIGTNGTEVAVK